MMVLAAAVVMAGNATIELGSFPTMSVADGRSTVTVSALIRDAGGNLVPNGTRVIFSCDRGSFREAVVTTQNGVARAILQAGNVAGLAKISVSAITFQATATMDYEFVSDRTLLSSAKEYVDVVAPRDLRYSMDLKTIEASGSDRTAVLQYRDIEIRAEDLQLNVSTNEVRAKNAILKIGKDEVVCGELYFRLSQRMGFGSTTFKYRPKHLKPFGGGVVFSEGEEREIYGMAEIRPGQIKKPDGVVPRRLFEMLDLSDSATLISAKKATSYPRKEVQFTKADVRVGGASIMKLPLFKVNMYTQTPILTDQMIKINDNQIAIDYPHYLSLKPGETSLMRFSMGRGGSRGISSNRGAFLDYEYYWNRGDEFQGGLTVQSIGRKDWGVSANQFIKLDDTSELVAQVDLPAHRAFFGTLNIGKQFPGFNLNASASRTDSLTRDSYRNQQYMLSLDKDPIKVGRTPLRINVGLTASHSTNSSENLSASRSVAGVRGIMRLNPVYYGRDTSLNGSLTLAHLAGDENYGGTTISANLTASQSFKGGGLALSYDYTKDKFTSQFLGEHQLSGRMNYYLGNTSLNAFMIKSLDVDRMSIQLDASYRFSRDWKLSYAYTYDKFLADGFLDYYFILGYRLGYREVGLTWSHRTKRIGFQILGTTFN